MTTRHYGYVVALEDGIREDDAEYITGLIMGIKGVIDVKPVDVGGMEIALAKSQLRHEFYKECGEFFRK